MIQNYDHAHQTHVQTKHNPLKGVKIHGFKTSSLDILKKKVHYFHFNCVIVYMFWQIKPL